MKKTYLYIISISIGVESYTQEEAVSKFKHVIEKGIKEGTITFDVKPIHMEK